MKTVYSHNIRTDYHPWDVISDPENTHWPARGLCSLRLQYPLFFPRPVPILLRCPLIEFLFSPCRTDLQLGASPLPVHSRCHQGIAPALHYSDESIDLLAAHEQFAGAQGIGIHVGGGAGKGTYMGADEPYLVSLEHYVAFLELDAALAQAFCLPTLQGDPRLQAFFDEIVVSDLLIEGDGIGRAVRFWFWHFSDRDPGVIGAKSNRVPKAFVPDFFGYGVGKYDFPTLSLSNSDASRRFGNKGHDAKRRSAAALDLHGQREHGAPFGR